MRRLHPSGPDDQDMGPADEAAAAAAAAAFSAAEDLEEAADVDAVRLRDA